MTRFPSDLARLVVVEAMVAELLPQRPTVDPQNAGRRRPIFAALRKDRFQQGRLDHVEEALIKIGRLTIRRPCGSCSAAQSAVSRPS